MISIVIALLTLCLVFISVFLVFVVLLQRANTSAGLGTAFGGGLAESTFGADTGNFLTRSTMIASGLFFVISFVVYLLYIGGDHEATLQGDKLPANLADIERAVTPAEIPETPLATPQDLEPALIGELPDASFPDADATIPSEAPTAPVPDAVAPATDTVPAEAGSGATAPPPSVN